MKRLLLTAAAGLMIAGPLSAPAFAQQGYRDYNGGYQQQDDRNYRDDRNGDRRGDYGYDDRGYDDRAYNDRGYDTRGYGDRDWRRDGDRRNVSQHHDGDNVWRDVRRNARWNDRDHNGYYIGQQWHSGRPSARDCERRGYAPGYQPWKRGDRLGGGYNQRYREVDYRDRHVQRPPQGYRWVENDNGDLIMAALVGGLIAAIVSNQ